MAFALENVGDLTAMFVQVVPGLAVIIPAALALRFRRLGGALLVIEAIALALWWAMRANMNPGIVAYLIMPGGLALAGLLLLVGKRPGEASKAAAS